LAKATPWVVAVFMVVAAVLILWVHFDSRRNRVPLDQVYVEKLKSAKRFQSQFPAPRQTIDLFHKVGLRSAAMNAIGMEPREVRGMASGSPESVFIMLSHLGGYGDIIWVDSWTNFPVKLPPTSLPGQIVVPRREAVQAALDAIKASGCCLIKAGKDRYLVARVSDKEKYEVAIRALGWLDGKPPPRAGGMMAASAQWGDESMNRYEFHLRLTSDQYLNYYRGTAKHVVVHCITGQNVQFPASLLQQFVTPQGIRGDFVLTCDEQLRNSRLERLK
jgi:uncharacterized protein DUF2835